MKKGKKAQHSFLSSVLIILVVLGVIILAWMFISKTMSKNSLKIEEQEKCMGVLLEIIQPDLNNNAEFKIKRMDSKEIQKTEAVDFLVLVDGKPATDYTLANEMTPNDFKTPFASSTITLKEPAEKSFEIAMKIGDTVCASTQWP